MRDEFGVIPCPNCLGAVHEDPMPDMSLPGDHAASTPTVPTVEEIVTEYEATTGRRWEAGGARDTGADT
jgi:hypothetical protein